MRAAPDLVHSCGLRWLDTALDFASREPRVTSRVFDPRLAVRQGKLHQAAALQVFEQRQPDPALVTKDPPHDPQPEL